LITVSIATSPTGRAAGPSEDEFARRGTIQLSRPGDNATDPPFPGASLALTVPAPEGEIRMSARSLTAALGAACSAVVLLLAAPGSASAASGQFRYTYTTAEGYEAVGFLNDPPSGQCINLQGPASEPGSVSRAPRNRTDATATVFLDADCEGDTYYVLPPGAGAGDRLLMRSVVFS
jgi:hypothetical protein